MAQSQEGGAVIAGHFGFAAAVKSRAPSAPLWALMLASVWLDVIFVPLFAAGIEPIQDVPGTHGGYGLGIIHADYTHSLVGALALAGAFGLGFAIWWGRAVGAVLGAVVLSHWFLDLPMHRADLPLLPGNAGHLPLLGFGLWQLPIVSAVLELAFVLLGARLYGDAAARVAGPDGAKRARHLAGLVVAFGVFALALNVGGF